MRILCVLTILPLLATAAAAQTPSGLPSQPNSQQSKNSAQAQQPQQTVQQQVRQNLEQAGFSDIKLMPSSFLVRAKDKSGNPVMMVINPDSITAVTTIPKSGSTTGQGSGSDQPQSGSGNTGSNK